MLLMARFALGAFLGASVLGVGAATALVQVDNFALAAELDRLSEEAEWNARRCSGLNPELERFEFDLEAEHTRVIGRSAARPGR